MNNRKLYVYPLLYVFSVYSALLLFYLSLNRASQQSTTNPAALLWLLLPIVTAVGNLFFLAKHRNEVDRIYSLNSAIIIKYSLIPMYLVGGLLIAALFLVMVVPALIMVSPMMIAFLSFFGWLYMVGGNVFSIPYLWKSAKERVHSTPLCLLGGICQFFFVLDVFSLLFLAVKEKRCIKSTIVLVVLLVTCVILLILGILYGNSQ